MRKILILGILLLLAYPAIANAATGFVDPNGDGATLQWTVQSDASHYKNVDDGIRQPTAAGVLDYNWTFSGTLTDIYDMTTFTVTGPITNVTVWGYGMVQIAADNVNVNIYMNGVWTTATNFNFDQLSVGSGSWKSVSFDGAWNQADLNAMQVKITNFNGSVTIVYEIYCVVTYTASATSSPYFIKKKKGIFFIK